jgi:hypothetical protein
MQASAWNDGGTTYGIRGLRRHRMLEWPMGDPPRMELIPLGGNRFRLAD